MKIAKITCRVLRVSNKWLPINPVAPVIRALGGIGGAFVFPGSQTAQDGDVWDGYQDDKKSDKHIVGKWDFVPDVCKHDESGKTGEKNSEDIFGQGILGQNNQKTHRIKRDRGDPNNPNG